MFNKHYINIVEKTSRITPKNPRNPLEPKLDERTIREIIENYRNQGSIIKIKEIKEKPIFDFPEATIEDKNKSIKSLNPNKATGPDRIPLKIIKTAANVIDSHLVYIVSKDLKENKFSENAKTALVRPIYKKDEIHETMKDAFYLVLKALFILKMFKFLSRLNVHVGKTASKFRESQPG